MLYLSVPTFHEAPAAPFAVFPPAKWANIADTNAVRQSGFHGKLYEACDILRYNSLHITIVFPCRCLLYIAAQRVRPRLPLRWRQGVFAPCNGLFPHRPPPHDWRDRAAG